MLLNVNLEGELLDHRVNLYFMEEPLTLFGCGCTILPFYQRYTRFLVSPHPCQDLFSLLVFCCFFDLFVFEESDFRGCEVADEDFLPLLMVQV